MHTFHAAGGPAGSRGARPARPGLWLLFLAAALFLAGRAEPARAGEPNRAALAVVFEDGTRLTRCIEFEGDEITGSELLARSGLATVLDSTHGGGITVCQIEGTGCTYPVDPCFCQCMGNGPCRYWNYYYRQPGQAEWVYSPLGALIQKSGPGSVEAWVWGDGHTPPDPALTFESICAPAPTSTPSLGGSGQPDGPAGPAAPATEGTPAPAPSAAALGGSPAPAATVGEATPRPSPTLAAPPPAPTPTAEPGHAGSGWRSAWPFGLMLMALGAIALYLRANRRL